MSVPDKIPHPAEALGNLFGIAVKAFFAANGVLLALCLWSWLV